ncbi:MAG: hypothetical protein WD009_12885 [Phycisphaeraceae bacterium]
MSAAGEDVDRRAGAGRTLPPFDARQLQRRLSLDAAIFWLVGAAVVASFIVAVWLHERHAILAVLPAALLLASWLGLNLLSASASRELPMIAAMAAEDPAAAERRLGALMRRPGLLSWVRLMLYHRLAVLRHRQHEFNESAAICAAVLARRLGPASGARAHLLLLLVEASLERGDLLSAYTGLTELHRRRLGLVESIQRLALQTRYCLVADQPAQALGELPRRIELAEILPAPQSGALHAMLARAADLVGQEAWARWLWARAELLCGPEQFARHREGQFGANVVETIEPDTGM